MKFDKPLIVHALSARTALIRFKSLRSIWSILISATKISFFFDNHLPSYRKIGVMDKINVLIINNHLTVDIKHTKN